MKSKIVLWGTNAQDEKVLIAIALQSEMNKVDIYTFPEDVATEEFYHTMMKAWRDGDGFELPERRTHLVRELSITGSLLPDDIRVENTSLIQRAQTEWHFVVLSSKLRQMFELELGELKEKVAGLSDFDNDLWDRLREFWGKLQQQIKERNLLGEHGDALRRETNDLFSKMKEFRKKLDEEFSGKSAEIKHQFFAAIDTIYERLNKGEKFQSLFDELKNLQSQFHQSTFTRNDRNTTYDRINKAFKDLKAKRFGGVTEDTNQQMSRLESRLSGLAEARKKMEHSIKHDYSDLEYERHKIETTAGQLEAQIRQAKILMIEERIRSKNEKLADMQATLEMLTGKLEKMKVREEKWKARQAAQAAAKEKIRREAEAAKALSPEEIKKLKEAARKIKESKVESAPVENAEGTAGGESLLEAVGAALGESLEDVVDTVSAVASVIGARIEESINELNEGFEKKRTRRVSKKKTEAPTEEPAAAPEPATANGADAAAESAAIDAAAPAQPAEKEAPTPVDEAPPAPEAELADEAQAGDRISEGTEAPAPPAEEEKE